MTPEMPTFSMPEEGLAKQDEGAEPPHSPQRIEGSPPSEPRQRRIDPRALVAVGLVGVLLGAGGAWAAQRATTTAAQEREAGARETALTYLEAIADGRASDAGALAPVEDRIGLLSDDVLATAERIAQPTIVDVAVDRDAASAWGWFLLLGRATQVQLELRDEAGEWRITTPLVEPLVVPRYGSLAASIAGVGLGGPDLPLLYPGRYVTDAYESDTLLLGPSSVVVDGLTDTAPEHADFPRPAQAVAERATSDGLAHARACARMGACGLDVGLSVEAAGPLSLSGLLEHEAGRRDLEFTLPLALPGRDGGEESQVQLRFSVSAEQQSDWECRIGIEPWGPCRS